MIGYTPSHLTENEVILEKLNQIIDYLTKNPSYQVFAYNGGFISGTLTYEIANIINSNNINLADVVVFNNGYYGIISEITETEFTLTAGISLIGPQGAKGDKGDKGDYGTGIFMYFKPIAQDLYQIDMDYVAKVSGRELQNGEATCPQPVVGKLPLFNALASCGNASGIVPVSPFGPCGPVSPLTPCGPCGPVSPLGPCGPVSPLTPCGPCGPISEIPCDNVNSVSVISEIIP